MSDVMSFDYSTAQWILSIVVGVCLTKVYSTIAHHVRYRKETVFYLPYLMLVAQTLLSLLFVWFQSPSGYQMVGVNKLGFLAKVISDSLAVIFTLVALPDEQILSKDKLDLKVIYYDTKKTWMIIWMIWLISGVTLSLFFGPEEFRNMLIGSIVITLVLAILMLKFDNDYLHGGFHLLNVAQMTPYLLI